MDEPGGLGHDMAAARQRVDEMKAVAKAREIGSRIARARELLEGTGWVMMRDVGTVTPADAPSEAIVTTNDDWRRGWATGHNACRAAMLASAKEQKTADGP